MRSFSLVIAALVSLTSAAPLAKIERACIEDNYDFVIAGGGTAGLLLANRLSASGTERVLVLEAGPVPTVVAAYETPGGVQSIAGSVVDWLYYTVPQTNLNGRILKYNRGRALGGSSVTNGLYYGRGSASVFDKWVELGNPGWGWDDLYPYSVQHTHFNPPDPNNGFDHSYETWDESAYSDGPLQIGFQGYVPSSNIAFINSCPAIGIPIVDELNNGNNTGVKQGTGCLDSQLRRSSSYDSFYMQAKDRENLDVLHYAPVQSINFEQTTNGSKATGVTFIDQQTALQHVVTANKEVILAAGAFNSPQLLMVSGVGPANQLNTFGINPVYINENVGQNMNDHSVFSIMAEVVDSASSSSIYANASSFEAAQADFYENLQGPYTAPSGITNGFQQLSNETLQAIGAQEILNRGLVNQSHVEFLYESVYYPGGPSFTGSGGTTTPESYYTPQSNLSYISLTASSLVALSRGNITLRGASMADAPVINPNYYEDPTDRAMAINSFKDLRKLLAQPELAQFAVGPDNGEVAPGVANVPVDADDDTIFAWVKANTVPNWHASGTCQMLPEQDGGVVDARLRVYGVESLRVIDVSIMPVLPDVNIQGPVYMLADKGAHLVMEDWGISPTTY